MKRSLIAATVGVGLCLAAFIALIVLGALWNIPVVIALGAVMTLVALWVLSGFIYRERIYENFEKKFSSGDFLGALTVLDRASNNHLLFPIVRMLVYELYIKGELAVDRLSESAKYVQLLRHNGGKGWKYRTAFYLILFNLDWGDIAAARDEYREFEEACSHSPVYSDELVMLRALFAHVLHGETSFPESVKNSPLPIVKRIAEKGYRAD